MAAARIIVGVLLGVVFGVALVSAGDALTHRLWPPPGLQTDMEAVRAYLAGAPLALLSALLLTWTIAAATAAFVAARIGRRAWAGWIAGGVLLAATLLNLALLPHPVWMWPAALALLPLAIWFVSKATAQTRAA